MAGTETQIGELSAHEGRLQETIASFGGAGVRPRTNKRPTDNMDISPSKRSRVSTISANADPPFDASQQIHVKSEPVDFFDFLEEEDVPVFEYLNYDDIEILDDDDDMETDELADDDEELTVPPTPDEEIYAGRAFMDDSMMRKELVDELESVQQVLNKQKLVKDSLEEELKECERLLLDTRQGHPVYERRLKVLCSLVRNKVSFELCSLCPLMYVRLRLQLI